MSEHQQVPHTDDELFDSNQPIFVRSKDSSALYAVTYSLDEETKAMMLTTIRRHQEWGAHYDRVKKRIFPFLIGGGVFSFLVSYTVSLVFLSSSEKQLVATLLSILVAFLISLMSFLVIDAVTDVFIRSLIGQEPHVLSPNMLASVRRKDAQKNDN